MVCFHAKLGGDQVCLVFNAQTIAKNFSVDEYFLSAFVNNRMTYSMTPDGFDDSTAMPIPLASTATVNCTLGLGISQQLRVFVVLGLSSRNTVFASFVHSNFLSSLNNWNSPRVFSSKFRPGKIVVDTLALAP